MAKPYRRKDSRFWWIAPWIQGQQVPQSSGETDYSRADRKLKILEGRLAANAPITPRTNRDTFDALLSAVITDYAIKERRSIEDLTRRIRLHLNPMLGHLPAGKVKSSVISEYVLERKRSHAANGTVNRELAIIKRAFNLGKRSGAVSDVPYIEMLPEDNERETYVSRQQFHAIVRHVKPVVASILRTAYITGWRIDSILKLEWRYVDLEAGFVLLPARRTKNRKAVRWPLMMGLREVLEERRRETDAAERKNSRLIPWVFHRNGQPVRSIRTAWIRARDKVGVPGYVIHDLRGTATVNLLEAGVDMPKVMSMVGMSMATVVRYAGRRGNREESLVAAARLLESRMGRV